jgi:hypothetical protein
VKLAILQTSQNRDRKRPETRHAIVHVPCMRRIDLRTIVNKVETPNSTQATPTWPCFD